MKVEDLKVKIFADGADYISILEHNKNPLIKGLTTNPTLMRKAGVGDYEAFSRVVLNDVKEKPISFEVFSDDIDEMFEQALKISSWGENVYVKIPVTNTKGESTALLINELVKWNQVKVNATAVFTTEQFETMAKAIGDNHSYISIFAGRIADSGINPYNIMFSCNVIKKYEYPNIEILWASPRQVYDVILADKIGIDIITCTDDIINKLPNLGKNLTEFSLDTVKMFANDAIKAGYTI